MRTLRKGAVTAFSICTCLLWLSFLLLISGCFIQPAQKATTLSATTTSQATATSALTSTIQPILGPTPKGNATTVTPEFQVTPTDASGLYRLQSLPKGVYLVFSTTEEGYARFGILSSEGKFLGYFLEGKYANVALSNHLKYLALEPLSNAELRLFDVQSEQIITFPSNLKTCGNPSWSPDDEFLALSCNSSEKTEPIDIYVLSLKNGALKRLTQCTTEAFICSSPSWSPDGKWIAFVRNYGGAGRSDKIGLNLLNTACLSAPSSCDFQPVDPFPIPGNNITWSPDGRMVAGVVEGGIGLFEVSESTLIEQQVLKIDHWAWISSLAWSIDGTQIAYSIGNEISLLSVENNRSTKIYSASNVKSFGWIEIK